MPFLVGIYDIKSASWPSLVFANYPILTIPTPRSRTGAITADLWAVSGAETYTIIGIRHREGQEMQPAYRLSAFLFKVITGQSFFGMGIWFSTDNA